MRRPPESIRFVARTHWLTGSVILVSVGMMHLIAMTARVVEFRTVAYFIGLGLALLYLLAGTAVWLGWPIGRALHAAGTVLFLPRPALGRRLWEVARSQEFRGHFRSRQSR